MDGRRDGRSRPANPAGAGGLCGPVVQLHCVCLPAALLLRQRGALPGDRCRPDTAAARLVSQLRRLFRTDLSTGGAGKGLPARIQDVGGIAVGFWTKDILTSMPAASTVAVGYLASRRQIRSRSTLFYVAFALGLIGSSWVSRLHSGAFDNVLMPAYACLA